MRTHSQAPLQFAKSAITGTNYPSVSITSQSKDLYLTMQFVENMFPNLAIVVCRRCETPSVQYANGNCKKVFGYDSVEVKKMTLPDFLTLVHPDDIAEVQQCFAFINRSEPYDPVLYRFVLHYRLKHSKGYYINVADEKMSLQDQNGEYLHISTIKDVTSEARFHDVKMDIHRSTRGEYKKIHTYIPRRSQSDFTPRQQDIVNLIDKGFTNQEIANRLSISVSTIKNHKSVLFRKANVKSTIELLSITRGR
jgi:PAS domain S-box-containing protein